MSKSKPGNCTGFAFCFVEDSYWVTTRDKENGLIFIKVHYHCNVNYP